jgi:hypothetical protein
MHDFDVIGYGFDGDIYCAGCANEEIEQNGAPIFANKEFDDVPICNECHEPLDGYEINDEDEDDDED